MKYVDKIIFRNKETYNRLYQGSELLFEVQKEVEWKGLTFTAIEPSTIKYTKSSVTTAQYSYDAVNWNSADGVTLSLNTGDKVYFKGNITGNQEEPSNSAQFTMTGKVAASGSIMSLQAGDPNDNSLNYDYEFYHLFYNCSSLITAPELTAKTLSVGCYKNMFNKCTNLETAPKLPATTLKSECYMNIFYDCESLTVSPELPATKLESYCYSGMFYGCHSLVNAPELPATTLANNCYEYMFRYCINLVNAPVLPATTLKQYCYYCMFEGCRNLNYIKCDAKTYVNNYFYWWVKDVAPTGDFYCYDSIIFPTGVSGIPEGWTVHSEVEHKQYDELLVSGRYNFKIPKGDGTYYVIDTKNDCEVDIISDNNFSSRTGKIFTSNSEGDMYEWDLFLTGRKLYFDLSFKNNRRLSWTFGTLNANTKYTIGGSNGNYLGTDRALYVNGSKKASSTTKSTYNNTSDVAFIGENVTDFYVGNIKIYEKTGLVYHIVPIMYNGNVAFYDKVNKRFMEIVSTPPSEYAKTRTTGEKVII